MNSMSENKVRENSLLRNIMRVLSANFWVAAIGFLGSFIFPHILTIEAYALYHTFTLYLGYITITHLGFPSGVAINYAGKDYTSINKRQYKSEVLLLIGILSFFTILFLFISMIKRNEMLVFVACAVIPTGMIGSYKAWLQSWSRFRDFSKVSAMLATAVPLAALLFFVVVGELTGKGYIFIYLFIQWVMTVFLFVEIIQKVHDVKAEKIMSSRNWSTEKIGIIIVLGNYINTLFISVDKQFVKWFFGNLEFAYYSFGMSMQSLMTVFIISIAQPLFPAMAQGKFKKEQYNLIKNLLIIFGSFSGCAYFAVTIIVKRFIQKYARSLDIVGIYFAVFPAMAVINCLYINLYKIEGQMKNYIKTLAGIFVMSVILNSFFIMTIDDYTGVALATTIIYYIWFFLGFKQFEFLNLTIKEIFYLTVYLISFFFITKIDNYYCGFIFYMVFICLLSFGCYRKELSFCVGKVLERYKGKTE